MTQSVTTLCPSCHEPLVPNARFCEACGAEVSALDAATAGTPAPASPACISCGAPADAIADDGYCGRCGMKQPAPGDHREVDLGIVAAVSDRGLHHHRNEDAFAVADFEANGVARRVVVVCDGVSSTADSHLAAQAAADAARAVLETATAPDNRDLTALTNDAVAAAQSAVCAIPAKDGATPSCTIVTAIASIVDDGTASLVVGWLGDSRAYWLRDGALHQISVDDSWATEQIAAGADPATAYADVHAHVITRWLGLDAIDTVPRVATVVVPRPATLLLCSDGLWNYAATEAELADRIHTLGHDLANLELARALTNFARDAGGHDNITVAVATL